MEHELAEEELLLITKLNELIDGGRKLAHAMAFVATAHVETEEGVKALPGGRELLADIEELRQKVEDIEGAWQAARNIH